MSVSALSPHSYSQKGLSATFKMHKQTKFALQQPDQKCDAAPFIIPLPERYEPVDYPPFSQANAQHIGSKRYQEDGFLPKTTLDLSWHGENKTLELFGVIDGHSDLGKVTDHIRASLVPTFIDLFSTAEETVEGPITDDVIGDVLVDTFNALAASYRETGQPGGATFTLLLKMNGAAYIANCGDSRAILVKKHTTYPLTEDAVLSSPRFSVWHTKRGHPIGYMPGESIPRIVKKDPKGIPVGLMMGREIGCRPWMHSKPKISKVIIGENGDIPDAGVVFCGRGDVFMLVTDGVLEPATMEELGQVVRIHAAARVPLQQVASAIAQKAGSCKGNDNVTVVLIPV